eukprot:2654175-Rhodomonas_salina.2
MIVSFCNRHQNCKLENCKFCWGIPAHEFRHPTKSFVCRLRKGRSGSARREEGALQRMRIQLLVCFLFLCIRLLAGGSYKCLMLVSSST